MNSTELKALFQKIKCDKKAMFIIIIGFVGMLLIALSEIGTSDEKVKTEQRSYDCVYSEDELADEVEKLIANIDGAGKTKVMLTYECFEETIYAHDEDENFSTSGERDIKTEYIIIDSGDKEDGLKLKIISPVIRGVAIVCQGGDNPVIKERIITSVSALFNISSNKISVAPMAK